MRKIERVFAYSLCAASLAFGLPGLLSVSTAYADPASDAPAAQTAPEAKIATCDMLKLTEALIESDAYAVPRKAKQEELASTLKPMQDELEKMQKDLQALGADARKPENADKIKTFSDKRETFMTANKEANDKFAKFFAGQFADAYKKVSDAATEAAHAAGYNYVLAQRTGPINTTDPQHLLEDLVGRPLVTQPAGSDLTDVVAKALKIVEKPATPPAAEGATPATGAGQPGTAGTPAPEKPASPEKPATPEK